MDLKRITEFQRKFVSERNWGQFHTPKNLVMALSGEAGELSELFQWLSEKDSHAIGNDPDKKEKVSQELADIFFYLNRLADELEIDLEKAFWSKMKLNEKKYPVELSKGNSKKYTELSLPTL